MKRGAMKTLAVAAMAAALTLWSRPSAADNAWLSANGIRTDNVTLNGTAVSNSTYWINPPFMSTQVPPNVLIILDNSGSMNDGAYVTAFDPTQFSNGHYYGYYDPAQCYMYSSSRWQVVGPVSSTTGCSAFSASTTTSSPVASGDLLNWATMAKIEVAKKLLIGGNANPRSMPTGCCVKLNGENSASTDSKTFDNTASGAPPDVIYPFYGNYEYVRSGSSLNIIPVNPATSPVLYPNANLSVSSNWTVFPSATSAYADVDEPAPNPGSGTGDGNSTYIQNQTDGGAALFNYAPLTSIPGGTITKVTVYVVAAREYNGSSNGKATFNIQAVLQVGSATYPSSTAALRTNTSNYYVYSFSYSVNPQTSAAWSWNDIQGGGTPSSSLLQGFGVQAASVPSNSLYPRITQVYAVVTATMPSGGPYSVVVDTGQTQVSGIIDQLSSEVRFGLAYYNMGQGIESCIAGCRNDNGCMNNCYKNYSGRYDGGHVDTYVNFGQPTNMITSIGNLSPGTWTPLAETLYEMVRYFQQVPPYYNNSPADYSVGQNYDPYYYQYSKLPNSTLADQYVPCAKSFILLLTDGESTMDQNIPAWLQDYNNDNKDPINDPNPAFSPQGTHFLDDVAYWARTTDLRSDLTGTQNVILYDVYMFGRGSNLLKSAAIYGGFDDLNGDGKPSCLYPQVPGSPTQTELKECYRDSNGDGTLDPATDLPLTYFEGDDAYSLQQSIVDAITAILKRAASGTSVAVLGSSWKGEGALYQAYFYPEKDENLRQIMWTGNFRALFVDRNGLIHEDTDGDAQLTPAKDRVVNFSFTPGQDTQAQLFWDRINNRTGASIPDGIIDSTTPDAIVNIGDIKPVWDAGKLLAARDPADRTIYTSVDDATLISFDPSNAATLRPFIREQTSAAAQNLIQFIRGTQLTGWRDRQLTVDGTLETWKLGDIVFSDPVVASAPTERYDLIYGSASYAEFYNRWKNRRTVVYVGSNDGMLHAFNGGFSISAPDTPNLDANTVQVSFCTAPSTDGTTCGNDPTTPLGKELWAFIPYDLLPHLAWLADPGYSHVYYVDLMPRMTDARIFTPDTDHVQGWGTILILGLRMGGGEIDVADDFTGTGTATTRAFKSAYYAFDITNPDVPPRFLWRFTDSELGFTTGVPAIVREGTEPNENWYAVFGSGPSNYHGGRALAADTTNTKFTKSGVVAGLSGMATTNAYLYVIDLNTGQPLSSWTAHPTSGRQGVIKTPDTNAFTADATVTDLPLDFRFDDIYAGTTFCASGCAADGYGTWSGNMYRIKTNNSTDPGTWALSTLFSPGRPITSKPSAAMDTAGNVWVYFGTGRFLHIDDRFDSSQQAFYGLKDPSYYSGATTTTVAGGSNLLNSTNLAVLTDGTLHPTLAANTLPGQTQAIGNFWALSNFMTNSGNGWYINLGAQERVTVNGFVVGGIAGFGTYTPSSDICEFEGSSTEYFPYYLTGTAYYFPQGTTASTYTIPGVGTAFASSVSSGAGLPSAPAVHIDAQGKTKLFIQQSTGAITVIDLPTAVSVTGGYGSRNESTN